MFSCFPVFLTVSFRYMTVVVTLLLLIALVVLVMV